MKKIALIVLASIFMPVAFAATTQSYLNADAAKVLAKFALLPEVSSSTRGLSDQLGSDNALVIKRPKARSPGTGHAVTSYYQYYQGLRVLNGEITLRETNKGEAQRRGKPAKTVSGQLVQGIEISAAEVERLKTPEKLDIAVTATKSHFLAQQPQRQWDISNEQAHLVIKLQQGKITLLYEVSFYATTPDQAPIFYHALLDPGQGNKIITVWNDVMRFTDLGPGGNEKTQPYHYGVEGIPPLEVSKKSGRCVLEDSAIHLTVVDMSSQKPKTGGYSNFKKPYVYQCASEVRDARYFMGAYSPADDAYFFGHLVHQLYTDWYQTPALDLPKMTLRVHYAEKPSESMDNAFWDPMTETMNFGDGTSPQTAAAVAVAGPTVSEAVVRDNGYYPFVSLDVTAHEMSHGFTSTHANLQYHDESGSLNESFSDMAAMAAIAYLREKVPTLYSAIYHSPVMVWSLGSRITRNPDPNAALRYYDRPARDGRSAECYQPVPNCLISYQDVYHDASTLGESHRQGYIVHHGSGVYNRFFYTLANTPGWDIQRAFGLMLTCNRDGYWGENTDFQQAACQTLLAASDLAYDTAAVRNAFATVGISTDSCSTRSG